jgi:hypothetical protein
MNSEALSISQRLGWEYLPMKKMISLGDFLWAGGFSTTAGLSLFRWI